MPPKPVARKVTVDREAQTLSVSWADGHSSTFPLDGLRRSCPCAGCAGGHEHMGVLPDPAVFLAEPERRWEQVRVEAVGAYAIRIYWDDGHSSGIYTWERLRATCPCCAAGV